jgi:hypothetical protein
MGVVLILLLELMKGTGLNLFLKVNNIFLFVFSFTRKEGYRSPFYII